MPEESSRKTRSYSKMVIEVDRSLRDKSWWQRRTSMERRLMRFMLLLAFLNIGLIVVLGINMTGRKSERPKRQMVYDEPNFCLTPACSVQASKLLQDMDLTADPCEDFYRFSCGGFVERIKIPQDDSFVNSFTKNEETVLKHLRILLDIEIQPTDIAPFVLLKSLYKSCLDTASIEVNGLNMLKTILNNLGGWPVLEKSWNGNFEWIEAAHELRMLGMRNDFLLTFSIDVDEKNTTRRLITVDQPNLGLHKAYFDKGLSEKIVRAYHQMMIDVAVMMGADAIATDELHEVLYFEFELSKLMPSYEDLRKLASLYNPMTIKQLQKRYPGISWLVYVQKSLDLPSITITENEVIDIAVPGYVQGLQTLLKDTPTRVLANYFAWRVVQSSLPFLTEQLRNRFFQFEQIVRGSTQIKPRWKQCMGHLSQNMKIALGGLYIRSYPNKDVLDNVLDMIFAVKSQYIETLQGASWLDQETKKKAIDKAAAMDIHVGYPEELLDDNKLIEHYAKLTLPFDDYFVAILTSRKYQIDFNFEQLRKPYNKSNWIDHSHPTQVDDYYDHHENSLRFSLGLLQGNFYNKDLPFYVNYGSLGFVIGHEITHGFDDIGAEFDKNGNLNNWWVNQTKKVFNKKGQCFISQYNSYTVPDINRKINGINNQEETIADTEGLRVAYRTYKEWSEQNEIEPKLPGLHYNPLQMFWVSAAHSWCAKYTNEQLISDIATDRDPPSFVRILGTIQNMEEFSKDFQCPLESGMNPIQKCRIW